MPKHTAGRGEVVHRLAEALTGHCDIIVLQEDPPLGLGCRGSFPVEGGYEERNIEAELEHPPDPEHPLRLPGFTEQISMKAENRLGIFPVVRPTGYMASGISAMGKEAFSKQGTDRFVAARKHDQLILAVEIWSLKDYFILWHFVRKGKKALRIFGETLLDIEINVCFVF
jgi:hypothetical protein